MPFHPYYTVKDSFGLVRVPDRLSPPSCSSRRTSSASRTTTSRPIRCRRRRHRAGMVLPALLRDPALDPEQAAGRLHDVRLDPGPVRAALARHLAGAQRRFRPIYKQVFWLLRARRDRARRLSAPHQPEGIWVVHRPHRAPLYYFLHFLVLLPLLGKLERPLPLPESISRPVLGGGSSPPPPPSRWRRPDAAARSQRPPRRRSRLRIALPAHAADEPPQTAAPALELRWLFGTFDRAAAQRGFQVYNEVCADCHSLQSARTTAISPASG